MQTTELTPPPPSPFRCHWALAPGTVFLNHGSFGACPIPVLELQRELRAQLEAEPVQFLWRHYDQRLQTVRQTLAAFVGAREADLAFVTNTTAGVNAVVRSLRLEPGDELLTTSHAYNACSNVLAETARRARCRLAVAQVPFPLPHPDRVTEAVLQMVTARTRLVLLDHVTSDSALIFPVAELVRELERRGVATLVDGAHAPGMLPLNLAQLQPAYYTGNLHKWVCAPKGAGFLFVREDKQAEVQPAVISHGNNTPRPGFTPFQDRFDWAGTFDPSPWLCAGEAIRWMGRLLPGGWAELQARNRALALAARQRLCERLEVDPPAPQTMLGSMATIPLPRRFQGAPKLGRIDPEQLELYDRFGIETPLNRIGNPERRYLRVSAQIYNSPEEYDYLAEALATLPAPAK